MLTNLDSILKSRDITLPTKVYGFSSGHVQMWELDCEESWVLKNWCFWTVVLEKTLESLGLQGDPTSPFWKRSALGVHWKDWCWAETPVLWPPDAKSWLIGKTSWFWEGLGTGGDGDDREWDGWMALPIRWAWVWVNSGSWWWTGRPSMLWFMGSQRVDTTEWLNRTNPYSAASLPFSPFSFTLLL